MAIMQNDLPPSQPDMPMADMLAQRPPAPQEVAAQPLGPAATQGTFNGPIIGAAGAKQVVNGVLEEGANRLYVSNNGQVVFNDQRKILGGRSPEGKFLPADDNLLFLLQISAGTPAEEVPV